MFVSIGDKWNENIDLLICWNNESVLVLANHCI